FRGLPDHHRHGQGCRQGHGHRGHPRRREARRPIRVVRGVTRGHAVTPIRTAVLTVSDRCSRGEVEDESGPALCAMLRDRLGAEVMETSCVPDAVERIAGMLIAWSNPEAGIDLILTTGGTGLAPS